jgi:hypothetical protein
MSTYTGIVHPGALDWAVTVDGQPLPPRNDLFNHSPDGLSWGYGGSGPSQLALAILAHHFRTYGDDHASADNLAMKLHQAFKRAVIAVLPMDQGFTLTSEQVQDALDKLGDVAMAVPRATVIHPDGTREHVTPENDRDFQLRELQGLVGGLIEPVPIPSEPRFMLLVDEEGLLKDKSVNAEASGLAQQRIVGTAVKIARRYFK